MPTNIIESSQELSDKDFFCLIIILLQSLVICNYNLVTSTWVCSIRILSSVGGYYPAPLALLLYLKSQSNEINLVSIIFENVRRVVTTTSPLLLTSWTRSIFVVVCVVIVTTALRKLMASRKGPVGLRMSSTPEPLFRLSLTSQSSLVYVFLRDHFL